jgi:CPA2 family monovalent cation:H+ antiporter-2
VHHDLPLITTIAAGLGLALVLGFVAARAKLPALVGYLLAGVLIGPFTPGFVADVKIASQLAEIGVMLLMFGVGLHFSLGDLLAVRRIAVPGAIVQMLAATSMGFGMAIWWGWSLAAALVFGFLLHRTSFGRRVFAIGNNQIAARFSGVRVERIKMILFCLTGLMSGIAAVLITSRLGSTRPSMSSAAHSTTCSRSGR